MSDLHLSAEAKDLTIRLAKQGLPDRHILKQVRDAASASSRDFFIDTKDVANHAAPHRTGRFHPNDEQSVSYRIAANAALAAEDRAIVVSLILCCDKLAWIYGELSTVCTLQQYHHCSARQTSRRYNTCTVILLLIRFHVAVRNKALADLGPRCPSSCDPNPSQSHSSGQV